MRYIFVMIAFFGLTHSAFAMDGVNTDTGDAVTVDDGTVFTVDAIVPVFNADGDELDLTVQKVTPGDKVVTVDFLNVDSGEASTFEFTTP